MAIMRKKSLTTTPMKSLCLVLGIVLLVMSTQFSAVNCRALRSTVDTAVMAGCGDEATGASMGTTPFAVASNNSSSGAFEVVRKLAFKLASGPSKRGPGH
ncbi:uncharacterized protein LOC132279050 [Cornus florida]|uniref:uncharacterized protein LOC132279050 n=1 Tax=Cornus florida TaxID=4283 RepID=UPI0028993DEA|nr:uncharacterized protein LOC132279050 [Cornus florida]